MARVVLGVTGSVAALKTPELVALLLQQGHELQVVATEPSLYFFKLQDIDSRAPLRREADEWPGNGYVPGDSVLHISLRSWADLLIIAPIDANSLGKIALGLCDNLLTSVARAWDFRRPVLLAPAMNTLMWESPLTLRHFRMILEDRGDGQHPRSWPLDETAEVFRKHAPGIVVIPPQTKRLACGDTGPGAMAEVEAIAEAVALALKAQGIE